MSYRTPTPVPTAICLKNLLNSNCPSADCTPASCKFQTLPASRNKAPYRSPQMLGRYSRLANKLNVARLVDIRDTAAYWQAAYLPRSNASHIEGTDAVGTAYIELLVIRSLLAYCHNSRYIPALKCPTKVGILGDAPVLHEVGLQLKNWAKGFLNISLSFSFHFLPATDITRSDRMLPASLTVVDQMIG